MSIHQEQQIQQPAPEQSSQIPVPTKKARFFSRKVAAPLWAIMLTILLVVFLAAGLISKSGSNDTSGNQASSTSTISNAGTAQPTQQSTPTSTQPQRWSTIQTFTGNGVKKTAIFSVPDDWKIVWTCTGQDIDGVTADAVFTVLVYNADGTLADSAVNAICKAGSTPTKDNTEEHQSGSVYLNIASTGNWTIQIQELK